MRVRSVQVGDEALLRVQGLLDGATAPALRHEVDAAVAAGAATVVVDLADVPSADVHGIQALAAAARRLAAAGRRLVLLLPGGGVAQVPGPAPDLDETVHPRGSRAHSGRRCR